MINRLGPQLAKIQSISLCMHAAQDINIGGRLAKTQYQYTLTEADAGEPDRRTSATPASGREYNVI